MTEDMRDEPIRIPIVEEVVEIDKRERTTGTVRVHTRVREEVVEIDEPLERVDVEVERVPIGDWVDRLPEQRREGDTIIIPVVEEVAVVVKRLRLVEEVRLTPHRTIRHHREDVTVRRTEADMERDPAPPES